MKIVLVYRIERIYACGTIVAIVATSRATNLDAARSRPSKPRVSYGREYGRAGSPIPANAIIAP